jgi:glycosyltransferase involved in cell wall biosynthesis
VGLRVGYLSDGHEMGGAEISLGHVLAGQPADLEATILATNAEVLEHLRSRRPDASAVLLPEIHSRLDTRAIAAHVRAVRALAPGILHVNQNRPWGNPWGLGAGIATRGLKVLTVDQMPREPDTRWHGLMKRATGPRVDAQVTLGPTMARLLAEISGVPLERIRVIPGGIPDAGPAPERRNDPPVVGSVGRLEVQKAHDLMVRALAELPGVRGVIVGDGELRPGLERLAGELGVADRIEFTGWRDDARDLINTWDLFVNPANFEAQGTAIMEAMLAGVPVVATAVGGTADVIDEGETGWLCRPRDAADMARAIGVALADRERLTAVGRRAREVALERYSAERMAEQFTALYRELAAD